MPLQIEKLQSHASHLLDAFIILKERYSILHPMLFNKDVAQSFGSGERSRGFEVLRHSLLLSCAQEIAKLSFDGDERTPSIRNLVCKLEDEPLRQDLRSQFSAWATPLIAGEEDSEIIEALKIWEQQETFNRIEQFDKFYQSTIEKWEALQTSRAMAGFRTIRDRVTAHSEVQYVADKYRFVDISELGITMGDLMSAIDQMQELVVLIELLYRNAGFSWDALDERLSKASNDFWN